MPSEPKEVDTVQGSCDQATLYENYGQAISGIAGSFTAQEAKALVAVLKYDPLPIHLVKLG